MARTGRLHLSIDLDRYHRLPSDIRVRFDGWMESEGLRDKHVVSLRLGEGRVIVERIDFAATAKALRDGGDEVVLDTWEYPVRTLPPAEAFTEREGKTA